VVRAPASARKPHPHRDSEATPVIVRPYEDHRHPPVFAGITVLVRDGDRSLRLSSGVEGRLGLDVTIELSKPVSVSNGADISLRRGEVLEGADGRQARTAACST
jgi:hypothetical protein